MLYLLKRLWRRLSDGARMLIVLWLGFIGMLLVMGALGLL